MADGLVFDLRQPYPNLIIDTMRAAVIEAIDDLAVHADKVDGALLLCLTAFDVAQTFLDAVLPLQQTVTAQAEALAAMRTDLDALTARVAVLEPTPEEPA